MRLSPALLALFVSTAALAQTPAQPAQQPAPSQPAARVSGAEGQRLSVTIYNDNLALVQDVRTLSLPAGRNRVEFRDVSAAIRPETVSLAGRGLEVVEQNFDYDLLSPAKLMEKAVGDEIVVVRTNPGNGAEVRETATVLAVNDGVVLRIGDRIEVLRDDGVPTRVIFDRVPENLRARPTLTVTLDAEGAASRETTLTYLTSGLSWKADYVALFDERAGRLDLQGWITLGNQSGTPFTNAEVQLVAGTVSTGRPEYDRYGGPPPPLPPRRGVRQAGTETGQGGRALADYYLYPLPERTTVAQNQTKQVGFLDAQGVEARKVYEVRFDGFQTLEQPVSADVTIGFSNAQARGLGAQLPAGIMRVYVRDQAGDPKFIGEQAIAHTPGGSQLSVKTGDAFDVTVQPTLESQDTVKDGRGREFTRARMRYAVRNARPEPVTMEVRSAIGWGDYNIREENLPSRRVDNGTRVWSVPVPANGETILTFTADNRDER
jgi:hypothetical protein